VFSLAGVAVCVWVLLGVGVVCAGVVTAGVVFAVLGCVVVLSFVTNR
jgi:hypothetical protein